MARCLKFPLFVVVRSWDNCMVYFLTINYFFGFYCYHLPVYFSKRAFLQNNIFTFFPDAPFLPAFPDFPGYP